MGFGNGVPRPRGEDGDVLPSGPGGSFIIFVPDFACRTDRDDKARCELLLAADVFVTTAGTGTVSACQRLAVLRWRLHVTGPTRVAESGNGLLSHASTAAPTVLEGARRSSAAIERGAVV